MTKHPLIALLEQGQSSGLLHPQVKVHTPSGHLLRFRLANRHSTNHGGINITEGQGYAEAIYWGKILADTGKLVYARGLDNGKMQELQWIYERLSNADVISQLAAIGKETGSCCFCGLALTNEGSILHGYGPICAEKYNLPWSDRDASSYLDLAPPEDF